MKIVVLGAGALGCAIGGTLTATGNEVWLVNRDARQVDVMNRVGLTMRSGGGAEAIDRVVKVNATTHARGVDLASGPVALIIVLVKSFHTHEVIESATGVISEHTSVLSLQNGVGHEDVLSAAVGKHRVLAGKTYTGGVMLGPGHVIAGIAGKETIIGELGGQASERTARIAEVFRHAGLATTVSHDILATIWEKLFVNVATGALSGITRLTYGHLYQVPEVEACAMAAVAEAMAVAQAAGIAITTTDPRAPWVKAAAGLPFEFKASMLQSLEAGSVTEIDFVNGAVVAMGQKYGVATPVNQTLVACMKGVEKSLPPRSPTSCGSLPPEGVAPCLGRPRAAASVTSGNVRRRTQKSYVEHVAIRVKDIHWHIRFFYEALGMDVREIDGDPANPAQYWTIGGLQLINVPGFDAPPANEAGWLAHLGVMVEDLDAAITACHAFGVKELPQGRNWLQLPDGLAVELIQAAPGSVAAALRVNPRALV